MYKNKERKVNYPHQKTVVTSTIVRTQNFNNNGLLRVNHSIIDSKSSNNTNANGSIQMINNRGNNNIHHIYNNANNTHSSSFNNNISRNNNFKSKNSNEIKQGTQPSSEERRLEQRQKQIEYGKNTIGYKIYTKVIKKENRKKTDPWTPDKYTKCSKRCWDGMVRSWRRQLHNWDPVNDDNIKMNIDQLNDTIPTNNNVTSIISTNDSSGFNNFNQNESVNNNNNINNNSQPLAQQQ